MNLPQLISRVEFHVNRTRSSRLDIDEHILPSINMAMLEIVKDRYDDLSRSRRPYSFEMFERVKSELRVLVVRAREITPVNNLLALPTDYWYDVGLRVLINGKMVNSESMTFNELNAVMENSFYRPTAEEVRHLEYGNTIEVKHGGGANVFSKGYLDYLRRFVPVSMAAPSVDLVVGKNYYVITDGTVYNGTTYNETGYFTAVTGFLTASQPVRSYVDCEYPDHLHEEVAQLAAVSISGHSGDVEKIKYNAALSEKK